MDRRRGRRNPRSAERLDGAAHAAAGRPVLEFGEAVAAAAVAAIEIAAIIDSDFIRGGWVKEVGLGLGTAEGSGGGVVGSGGILGGIEGSEPDASLLPRISDLRRESAPWSLPHAAKSRFSNDGVSGFVRYDGGWWWCWVCVWWCWICVSDTAHGFGLEMKNKDEKWNGDGKG